MLGACTDETGPPLPSTIAEVSGNNQTGLARQPLGQSLVVKVGAATGAGVANVTVIWAVVEGGGSLSAASVATDPQGQAAVTWTLGPVAGSDNNRVTASVTGLAGSPVTFTANATPNATISGTVTVTSKFLPSPPPRAGVASVQRLPTSVRGAVLEWYSSPRMAQFATPSRGLEFTPDELIVTFRPAALGAPPIGSIALAAPAVTHAVAAAIRFRLALHAAPGRADVAGISPAILAARIRMPAPERLAEVAAELRSDPAVAVVERNGLVRALGDASPVQQALAITPNDFFYPLQAWHYGMVDLPQAWAITTGSASVLVAVVDDGIRFDHPDIAANLTADGFDFVSNIKVPVCGSVTDSIDNAGDGDPYDPDPTVPSSYGVDPSTGCATTAETFGGHGLFVAATIGAVGNNLFGVSGVNWTVRIRPVRALGVMGFGTEYDAAQGILYAAGLPADNGAGGTVQASTGARVINLSFGSSQPADVERNAVIAANNAGALLVASAGNSATSDPEYPAAYPEALSVSAVGPDGLLASYSSLGPTIDIAAPGGDFADASGSDFIATFGVASTGWDFQSTAPAILVGSGTSFAAPHVSGVAALLVAQNPALTRDELRSRLTTYAVDAGSPGRDDLYGAGIVNARNSLTQSFAPPQATYVRLYDLASGAALQTVAVQPDGSYAFTTLPDGRYHVFAGQDESGDQLIGVPGRRWGAFGGSAVPTPVTVSGAGSYSASFTMGFPAEAEPNNSTIEADLLYVGGYVHAQVAAPGSLDFVRVLVPASGQYTFETSAWDGACGFALEEDTILGLYDAGGNLITSNDDINVNAGNFCSRITAFLTSGTYYLTVDGYVGRRYRLSARAGW